MIEIVNMPPNSSFSGQVCF